MSFSFLLTIFTLCLPIFGKSFDYQESVIVFGCTLLFYFFGRKIKPNNNLHQNFILWEIVLICLFLVSTIFSQNIGFSYYAFIKFLFTLLLLNLVLKFLNPKIFSKCLLFSSLIYGIIFILIQRQIIHVASKAYLDNFLLQIWGHSYFADFIILAYPISLFNLIYQKNSRQYQLFYFISSFFLFIALILTHSRSAAIAFIIENTILLLPKIKKILRPIILIPLFLLVTLFISQLFFQNLPLKSWDGDRPEYWHQAIRAFINSPLLGQGPGNFNYVNKLYESYPNSNTNYAHSSLLESLCLQGLPYTIVLFGLIFLSLFFQFKNVHLLNFTIGTATLINSFLDPSWSSLGIFIISLFYIFNQNPKIIISEKSSAKPSNKLNSFLFIICLIYFLSKTTADILYLKNFQSLSLYFDPFNINTRQNLISTKLESTEFLYAHNIFLEKYLIQIYPLPIGESSYYRLFSLSPKENLWEYYQLANYYYQQKNFSKLDALLSQVINNINIPRSLITETMPLAKVSYYLALDEWSQKQYDSAIKHFQYAIPLSQGWSLFYIELANAYWFTGQKDLALKELNEECLKYPISYKHCQQYLNTSENNFFKPGNPKIKDVIDALVPAK